MPSDTEKSKVIIIDDDDDILRPLVDQFQKRGYEVTTFKVGSEAISFLMEKNNIHNVKLLILDRILPDMDGIDILQKLISQYKNQIPVLILSTLDLESDMILGLQNGAMDYIGKPLNIPLLMQKAENLIANQCL